MSNWYDRALLRGSPNPFRGERLVSRVGNVWDWRLRPRFILDLDLRSAPCRGGADRRKWEAEGKETRAKAKGKAEAENRGRGQRL